MTKQIVAIGRTINGVTTTVYAPELKHRVNYRNHAVALWSELDALTAMVEAAGVPGMDERIASAKEVCEKFYEDWMYE